MKPAESILIIGGNQAYSRDLQLWIEGFGYQVAGVAPNLQESLKALATLQYDLVLLDIKAGEEALGIELGRIIPLVYQKPVLFITCPVHPAKLQEGTSGKNGREVSPPIDKAALFDALQHVPVPESAHLPKTPLRLADEPEQHLFFFVKNGASYKKIEWADVVCLTVEQNYTRIYTRKDKSGYLIRCTLQKTWDDIIPGSLKKDFIRVNRSEIVQVRYIEEVKEGMVMTMLKSFTITKSYWVQIKEKLRLVS